MTIEWPRLPGERLAADAEPAMIKTIRRRWGDCVNYFPSKYCVPPPLFVAFPEKSVVAVRSIMAKIRVPHKEILYFYDERPYPGQLFTARFGEILQFVSSYPEYGSRTDRYFMPVGLEWCICYAHEEEREGHLMLLQGPVPMDPDAVHRSEG